MHNVRDSMSTKKLFIIFAFLVNNGTTHSTPITNDASSSSCPASYYHPTSPTPTYASHYAGTGFVPLNGASAEAQAVIAAQEAQEARFKATAQDEAQYLAAQAKAEGQDQDAPRISSQPINIPLRLIRSLSAPEKKYYNPAPLILRTSSLKKMNHEQNEEQLVQAQN